MGAVASVVFKPNPNSLFVDKNHPLVGAGSTGFSWAVFTRADWALLKMFCNKYKIRQQHLSIAFRNLLTYEEVYIMKFKVRTRDIKMHYALHSKLEQVKTTTCFTVSGDLIDRLFFIDIMYLFYFHQEIAACLIPLMYMREFPGMDVPKNPEEITFTRCIIVSFLFGAQQFPDFIHEFFGLLRQKLSLDVSSSIAFYSFEQTMTLLVEDLQPSAAKRILMDCMKRLPMEHDISILYIVKLGVKYPLLFYVLERFRKHLKRLVFGEFFWMKRKWLRLRLANQLGDIRLDVNDLFQSESVALLETSRTIIAEAVLLAESSTLFHLSDAMDVPPVFRINERCNLILKNFFGYENSRQLIVDSELPMEHMPLFVEKAFGADTPIKRPISVLTYVPSSLHDAFEGVPSVGTSSSENKSIDYYVIPPAPQAVLEDKVTGRSFKYDTTSGMSQWVEDIEMVDDEVLEEFSDLDDDENYS